MFSLSDNLFLVLEGIFSLTDNNDSEDFQNFGILCFKLLFVPANIRPCIIFVVSLNSLWSLRWYRIEEDEYEVSVF